MLWGDGHLRPRGQRWQHGYRQTQQSPRKRALLLVRAVSHPPPACGRPPDAPAAYTGLRLLTDVAANVGRCFYLTLLLATGNIDNTMAQTTLFVSHAYYYGYRTYLAAPGKLVV